jgi:hypothetical protein
MTDFVRDAAAAALIFGFFASAWFGWAQEKPPPRLRPWLIAGSVAALATAAAGGILMATNWSAGTAFDRDTSMRFGIVVGIEFALAGIGAAVLTVRRRSELVPVWIAFVVGVHLFPVAVLLHYPLIHVARSVAVSAVVGLLTGTVLLASALVSLARFLAIA